jgi:hypothetical protein
MEIDRKGDIGEAREGKKTEQRNLERKTLGWRRERGREIRMRETMGA